MNFRERRRFLRCKLLQRWLVPTIARPMVADSRTALIVAPHQDDETLACGGLIALKRRAGIPVVIVFLTDGSRSHEGQPAAHPREELIAVRQKEAHAALSLLGIAAEDIHFLCLPDGGLRDLVNGRLAAVRDPLLNLIERYKPETIFMPHRRDDHPDHEAAFTATVAAIQASSHAPAVYAYPVWLFWHRNRLFDNLKWRDVSGGCVLNTEAVAALKRQAMAKYGSQLEVLPPAFVQMALTTNELFFPVNV